MVLAALAPLAGAALSAATSLFSGNKNAENQKEFAQHGIQWKVEDAKKAGIHPLYALGAQTHSFAPSWTGDGGAFAQAGQDVSRAMMATADAKGRTAINALSLERAQLENDLLRAQILKTNASIGPAFPTTDNFIPGQGNSGMTRDFSGAGPFGLIKDEAMKRTMAHPDFPHMEPGAVSDLGYARTASGGYAPVPSLDVKQRIEDNFIAEMMWMFRNQLLPTIGMNQSPPRTPVPKGYDAWIYSPLRQEYTPHKSFKLFGRHLTYY